MDNIQDDFFGTLEWNDDFQEWNGFYKDTFGVSVPTDYIDSIEIRQHIQTTVAIIARDELSFREKAATQLFEDGGYVLFWEDNREFDRAEFVREMCLVYVVFGDNEILLSYAYNEYEEHDISIMLSREGEYKYAQ